MKLLIVLTSIFFMQTAIAGGDNVGNGGDICENRFQIIRNDIQSWILLGGGAGLKLPGGATFATYNQAMLSNIATAAISCTDQVLKIGNVEKTCLNFSNSKAPYIICNSLKFQNTRENDQYILVHHEYAGLSGLEVNTGEESDYRISNQLSYFLEDQIVKKLVIKPPPTAIDDPFAPNYCPGPMMTVQDSLTHFKPAATEATLGSSYKWRSRIRSCHKLTGCSNWIDSGLVSRYEAYQGMSVISKIESILKIEGSKVLLYLVIPPEQVNFQSNTIISNPFQIEGQYFSSEEDNLFWMPQLSPTGENRINLVFSERSVTNNCLRFKALHKVGDVNGLFKEIEIVIFGNH